MSSSSPSAVISSSDPWGARTLGRVEHEQFYDGTAVGDAVAFADKNL
jgi:hypothetical protein